MVSKEEFSELDEDLKVIQEYGPNELFEGIIVIARGTPGSKAPVIRSFCGDPEVMVLHLEMIKAEIISRTYESELNNLLGGAE